jgi:hypothetical protein
MFNLITQTTATLGSALIAASIQLKIGDRARLSPSYAYPWLASGVVDVDNIIPAEKVGEVDQEVQGAIKRFTEEYMSGMTAEDRDYKKMNTYINTCIWVQYSYINRKNSSIRALPVEEFLAHASAL